MTLSIIIVSYNTRDLLIACLSSIRDQKANFSVEVIVVDNNSHDNSVAAVKSQFPRAKILQNKTNMGFAKANNLGLELCTGKYVMLLNSDTKLRQGALTKLVDVLDTYSNIGIVGPKLLNEDMSFQFQCRRGFPRLLNSVFYMVGRVRGLRWFGQFSSYSMLGVSPDRSLAVDSVSGACMVIRREIIPRIGGLFDESYFMHFEDIDLCQRARQSNWIVFYVHEAEVIHLKGASSLLRLEGVRSDFWKSALVYFDKYYRRRNVVGYITIWILIRTFCIISERRACVKSS